MQILRDSSGFSLIELIVVAVIINILAGVAIVAYIGTQEKARVALVIRDASSSSAELQLWLQSSFSHKQNLRELDTNFSGKIDAADMTNLELQTAGVANVYINARNTILRETSPWFERPLWNSDETPPNGTINLIQPTSNQIRIVAKEKNGLVVFEKILFAN